MTVSCVNNFMAKVKTNILNKNALRLLVWKRSIDIIWAFKHMKFLSQMVAGSQLFPMQFNLSSHYHIYILKYLLLAETVSLKIWKGLLS